MAQVQNCFIAGLAMVKNEEEILEPFIRHNLQFVDSMYILENGSADHTRDILVKLQQEGLPIVIFDDPDPAYNQSIKMTRLLKSVSSTVFPDFVVPIDADEFIRCSSKEKFLEILKSIPPCGAGLLPWQTFVVTPHDEGKPFLDTPRCMTYRRVAELPAYYKAILRLDGCFRPELAFAQGNHAVVSTRGSAVPQVELKEVVLGHFPVRNCRQMEIKAFVSWMAYLLKDPHSREKDEAYQWRNMFDQLAEGGAISHEKLCHTAMNYAQNRDAVEWHADVVNDPMDFHYKRSLGGFQSKPGLATIAKSMEAMLAAAPKGFEAYLRKVRSQKTDAAAPHCSWLKRVAKRVLKGKGYRNKIVLDLPPFRHLFDVFQPGSVLEVGCGLGAYLLYLEQLGAKDVFGMDGTQPSASLLENHRYLQHDLTAPFELGRQFDLVICVGVVDHLETSSEDFLKRLSKHAAGRILFSAAEPGQPGVGHSHCRPLEYWLASWDDLGWECDVQATLAFRSLATFAKLRRNPMVLQRKSGSGNVSQRPSILQEIARKPYKWYGREAAIITRPLSEVPPDNVYR